MLWKHPRKAEAQRWPEEVQAVQARERLAKLPRAFLIFAIASPRERARAPAERKAFSIRHRRRRDALLFRRGDRKRRREGLRESRKIANRALRIRRLRSHCGRA